MNPRTLTTALVLAAALLAQAGPTAAEDTPPAKTPADAPEVKPEDAEDAPLTERAREDRSGRRAEAAAKRIVRETRRRDGKRYDIDGLVERIVDHSRENGAAEANAVVRRVFGRLPSSGAFDPAHDFAMELEFTGLVDSESFGLFLDRWVTKAATNKIAKRNALQLGRRYMRGIPVSGHLATQFLSTLRKNGGKARWGQKITRITDWIFGLADPIVDFRDSADPAADAEALAREVDAWSSILGKRRSGIITRYLRGGGWKTRVRTSLSEVTR